MSARAVTAMDPRIVPLIVCGRKNFQNACWNANARSTGEAVSLGCGFCIAG